MDIDSLFFGKVYKIKNYFVTQYNHQKAVEQLWFFFYSLNYDES